MPKIAVLISGGGSNPGTGGNGEEEENPLG